VERWGVCGIDRAGISLLISQHSGRLAPTTSLSQRLAQAQFTAQNGACLWRQKDGVAGWYLRAHYDAGFRFDLLRNNLHRSKQGAKCFLLSNTHPRYHLATRPKRLGCMLLRPLTWSFCSTTIALASVPPFLPTTFSLASLSLTLVLSRCSSNL